MNIYRNTFFCFLDLKFSLSINISDLHAKLKKWQFLQIVSCQSYITQVTLPIYSEGSNECTFIPRWKFLTLGKFYMYKVHNWISWNFFIQYKIPIWGHNRSQYQYHKTLKMHSETKYLKKLSLFSAGICISYYTVS